MFRKIIFILLISTHSFAADLKIALNWKPEAEFGGYYAAQVNEIFKKHKLNVELIAGGAGTPSVQMVGAGKFDFGIASADEIAIAQSRGVKIIGLFATYQTNTQAIMTHEERGFQSLNDVFNSKGQLALQKGLPYALFLERKFKSARAQIVPFLGGINLFLVDKNYSQQCFLTSEPLSAEKKSQKVKSFLIADAGYNPYTTVLITRQEYLDKNPALVSELVSAIREGHEAYLKDAVKTNQLMNRLNPSVDLETLNASAALQVKFIEVPGVSIGSMSLERWTTLVDQLVDLGLMKKKVAATQLFRVLAP
jgi:NitT/TauT family transport system substrate-binding protein